MISNISYYSAYTSTEITMSKMSPLKGALLLLVCLVMPAFGAEERHLLYFTTPDGAQGGGSGTGLLIYDINDGHKFVRRIEVPSFKGGVRGVCANAITKRLYVSTSKELLICMDLLTDKIIWEKNYGTGCDRMAVTPDGKTLYVPSGWWGGKDHHWMVVDGQSGEVVKRIPVKGASHNTLTSLDGKFAYLASSTTLSVVDVGTNDVVHEIHPIGETGVFPFTVNAAGTRAYVCLGNLVGFDIADLTNGKVIGRVLAENSPKPTPQRRRTHGAGLTPDEKELWISDQADNALYVFDNTVEPPRQTHRIDVHNAQHGWVAFSLDGKYAWCSSPDIIDAKTKQIVGTFKDEKGANVASSKFVEIVFKDGDVVKVGDQFGVGRK